VIQKSDFLLITHIHYHDYIHNNEFFWYFAGEVFTLLSLRQITICLSPATHSMQGRVFPYNFFHNIALCCYVFVCCAVLSASGQEQSEGTAELSRNITSQGREFWIAIPQNDYANPLVNALEIYVTSSQQTTVTLEHSTSRFSMTKEVKPYTVTTFTTRDASALWNWELTKSETIESGAIHITAEHPVSVYVMSAKERSADGYTALPVQAWGREYMHCGYYDHYDETLVKEWGGGFVVVSADNGTEITLRLRGKNINGAGRTVGGRTIPFQQKIILNKGETYVVQGNGKTIGTFDLTGSSITANKPIGVISYHQRAMVPSNNQNGRSYLVEMIPPLHAWGKRHVALEYQREGKGDFFRILASENDTRWSLSYYDKNTGKLLRQSQQRVLQAGDFYEELNSYAGRGQAESIRGVSVWESNKPVLIMQYSYSTFWDNTNDYDPFMTVVSPVEQYITATVFETPTLPSFQTHWFNMIAVGDTKDSNHTKLKSILLDGQPLWQIQPQLLQRNIPGTDLYWAQIKVTPGSHLLAGTTPFTGHIYGFGNFNSYGMPAAISLKQINRIDTLPPVLTKIDSCGNYHCTVKELRNEPGDPRLVQKDQGIYSIELVGYLSDNYRLKYRTASLIPYDPVAWVFDYTLEVIDPSRDAIGIVTILDRAGNALTDTVHYQSPDIRIEPQEVHFGNVRAGSEQKRTIRIINTGLAPITVSDLSLTQQAIFAVETLHSDWTIAPNDTMVVTVICKPPAGLSNSYNDNLSISLSCASYTIPLTVRAVRPCAELSDSHFGKVIVGTESCSNEATSMGCKISNQGTDTLIVYAVMLKGSSQMTLDIPSSTFPLFIPPNDFKVVHTICFTPSRSGADSAVLSILSNSDGGCRDSAWVRGIGIKPGPVSNDIDYGIVRVKTSVRKTIELWNRGTAPVTLRSVEILDTRYFRKESIVPALDPNIGIVLNPNDTPLLIDVSFTPLVQGNSTTIVRCTFENNEHIESLLTGIGFVPDLEATGFTFADSVLVKVQHPIIGNLSIRRMNRYGDVKILSVRVPQFSEFTVAGLPNGSILTLNEKNKEKVFPVYFVPQQEGKRRDYLIIESDCSEGPEPIASRYDTVWFEGYGKTNRLNGKPNITTIDTLDFGITTMCAKEISEYFAINNPGGTDTLIIYGFELIDGDATEFSYENLDKEVSVLPDQPQKFRVSFSPQKVGTSYATIRILDNIGSKKTIVLKGLSHRIPVRFEMASRRMVEPGAVVRVPIAVRSLDIAKAECKKIRFTVMWKTKQAYFPGQIHVNTLLAPTWKVSAPPISKRNDTLTTLQFELESISPLAMEGTFVEYELRCLMSDEPVINLNLDAEIVNSDHCAQIETLDSDIELTACFVGSPKISTGKVPITLNLSSEQGQMIIHYSTSLKLPLYFEIFNALGEKVRTIPLPSSEDGYYQFPVDINSEGKGWYMCVFSCGPYKIASHTILQ